MAVFPRITTYQRLEPHPQDHDLERGFAAILRDPVWMLARQWQMGEHQAENASTPVRVEYQLEEVAIEMFKERPPQTTPIEPLLEQEPSSWWTMGRRILIGRRVATAAGLAQRPNLLEGLKFQDPPPPYEHFEGLFDGWALWRNRALAGLELDVTLFNPLPPPEPDDSWQTDQLVYKARLTSPRAPLDLPRHMGGRVDWYSVEVPDDAPVNPLGDGVDLPKKSSVPGQLQYPGAPNDRWWAIENAAVDIGGYPPDPSHFPTLLLIDLISSHSIDWFLFTVSTSVGQVVALRNVTVFDSFDDDYPLHPPENWSLFKTTGLDAESLVIWPTALTPIEGPPLEEVLFGIDEYSNCLWAVERRVRGREVATPDQPAADTISDTSQPRRYEYLPALGLARGWHPYVPQNLAIDGLMQRRFVQARIDPDVEKALRTQPPQAAVLGMVEDGQPVSSHNVSPAAIPSNGIVIQRQYALTRSTQGEPLLWVQRVRRPLLAPPSRQLRFDVVEER